MEPPKNIIDSYRKYFSPDANVAADLRTGNSGPAVCNTTRALSELGFRISPRSEYNDDVTDAVRRFQKDINHTRKDGILGPNTRRQLVFRVLCHKDLGADYFLKLDPTCERGFYSVFISHARQDSEIVKHLQTCLHHKGINPILDETDFPPGADLEAAIRAAIESVDKVLVVATETSPGHAWMQHEATTAATIEPWKPKPFVIRLKFMAATLPPPFANKLYIECKGKTLAEIASAIESALSSRRPPRQLPPYDPDLIPVP